MKFEDKHIVTAEGKKILVREANITDAEELLRVVKTYVESSEFIPYAEGEFNLTVEQEREWIQSLLNQNNSLLLLAVFENKIIGNICCNGRQRKMMRHVAEIGMGLLEDYCGDGIGTVLLRSVIDWAKLNSNLEYLVLDTYASNKRAQSIYEKCGFEIVGRQNRFFKLSDSEYEDNITMTLSL